MCCSIDLLRRTRYETSHVRTINTFTPCCWMLSHVCYKEQTCEDRSGHGFLDLDTARMLHDAVFLVIKDDGFRLSTSPAKKALGTAEKVLE